MNSQLSLDNTATFKLDDNQALLTQVRNHFSKSVENDNTPLFTTDVQNLYATYLDALPAGERQYHTCTQCRKFIEIYGGLVTITAEGIIKSALWHEANAPEYYRSIIASLARSVQKSRITGVFLSDHVELGNARTSVWPHFSVKLPKRLVFKDPILSSYEKMCEKREDFATIRRALNYYSLKTLKTALTLLKTEALYRSEKVLGAAQWLCDLQQTLAMTQNQSARDNIIWRAVAEAPAGFCHPRSAMLGTLLDDIESGSSYDAVAQRFAAKMHPLSYLRPKAPPKEGTINQAEKLMAHLQAENALARRFAHIDEIQALWRPKRKNFTTKPETPTGIFANLRKKVKTDTDIPMTMPTKTMTWNKFSNTVLPLAERIELFVPNKKGNYATLLTALLPEAPPIFQWDHEFARNPVSWYVWNGGSAPNEFLITADQYHDIAAVTHLPFMWHNANNNPNFNKGVIFIVDGARETKQTGNAIFPECLKTELHPIRSVLEAYSKKASITGMHSPHACGLLLSASQGNDTLLRVTSHGVTAHYRLDRLD